MNISHLYLLMIQFYFVVHLHSNSYISGWCSSVEAVTSLKVYVGKSEVVPVDEVDNLVALADILGCRIASLPMTYLGMPFGAHFKVVSMWDYFRDGEETFGLEETILFYGGRLTLLKSTLSIYPIYYLSLFIVPKSMVDRLERIRRNLLWGALQEEFKYLLVAWVKVCSPIKVGGLGVRRIGSFNQALLGKLLSRFWHEATHLWHWVIVSKYREDRGGWCAKFSRGHAWV